jgi:hypothetical protein
LKPLKKTVTILRYFSKISISKFHFVKQILGKDFVTIAMVGLDRDLMKEFKLRNHYEAQKNMFAFTEYLYWLILLLSVGALLYIYAKNGIEVPTDL